MKVKVKPLNVEFESTPDKSLKQLCLENGVQIKSTCRGIPQCAECRIKIEDGEYNVLPPTKAEINLIGSSYFVDQRRLSCQVRCFGDITIDVTEQLEKVETQNKKIRGFKPKHQVESHAVQDTMVLAQSSQGPTAKTQDSPAEKDKNKQNKNVAKN